MRARLGLSKRPRLSRACAKSFALLAGCVAAPLLGGLMGCGGNSASDSQVSGVSGYHGGTLAGGFNLPPDVGTSGGANGSGGSGGSGSPAPYMLPVDFTRGEKGGYKLGAAINPASTGSAGATGSGGGVGSAGSSSVSTGCGTQILGIVRDFKGDNEMGGHPDFEHFAGTSPSLGIVKPALGADQKPVYAGNGPIYDPSNGQQTTDQTHFDQWYRATPNVNKPFVVYFYFEPNGGVLTFQSTAFFPLDGAGWGNTPGKPHNFGFTTEVHTRFNYKGGETFAFTGDDDLWVFINHKLAIDLGGLHQQQSSSISLDQEAAKLGISAGSGYDLDLFHAERHSNASNFRVDTNLEFTNCGTIVEEPPVK